MTFNDSIRIVPDDKSNNRDRNNHPTHCYMPIPNISTRDTFLAKLQAHQEENEKMN